MKTLFALLLFIQNTAIAKTPESIIQGSTANNWVQAGLAVTDRALDLAIQGNGFFMVEDRAGISCFTRRGRFELTEDGFLRNLELNKNLVSIVNGVDLKPISLVDFGRMDGSPLISMRIELSGEILGFYKNGYSRKLGRVALALFQNQRRLERLEGHCLQPTEDSGDPYLDFAQVDGRGSVYASSLEEIDDQIYQLALDKGEPVDF